jgi:predicted RND superfamily exporter protein
MTITIAAITIGIAVDDTIHYVHRYRVEWLRDKDYAGAIHRSHASIGLAMYYTTMTITVGFAVLALSDFTPTIYFGVFTAFAMLAALLANIVLLPVLMQRLRVYGADVS